MIKLAPLAISLMVLAPVALAHAEAPISVEGRYEYRTDAESRKRIGDKVCFYPSPGSLALIPRAADDTREPWFCFRNTTDALERLKIHPTEFAQSCGAKGVAMLQAVKYESYAGKGDGPGVASMGRVMWKSPPSALACSK